MHKILNSLIKRMKTPELMESNIIDWSAPVLSFGDFTKSKVATLGLNPSNREFVDYEGIELQGTKRRFHTLKSLGLSDWSNIKNKHIKLILNSYIEYFNNNPYDRWFKSLDVVIRKLNLSYYSETKTACHLDLVPFATKHKWGELSTTQQKLLLKHTGDSLAEIINNSPIRILILNGMSVVRNFEIISSIKIKKTEMRAWTLYRRVGNNIKGYSYKGELQELFGVKFKRKILVLGYNHNIQSSFGVTNSVKSSIGKWIAKQTNGL